MTNKIKTVAAFTLCASLTAFPATHLEASSVLTSCSDGFGNSVRVKEGMAFPFVVQGKETFDFTFSTEKRTPSVASARRAYKKAINEYLVGGRMINNDCLTKFDRDLGL